MVAHGKNISVSDDLEEDEKQRYYSEVLPQMAIDCLYSDTAKFDRIIVDEAQDIISESGLVRNCTVKVILEKYFITFWKGT